MINRSPLGQWHGVALLVMSAVALAGGLGGCRDTEAPTEPQTIASRLRAASDLIAGCYTYSGREAVGYDLAIRAGDAAIDFTLRTPSGEPYTLSELLETKPALIVFGAFT